MSKLSDEQIKRALRWKMNLLHPPPPNVHEIVRDWRIIEQWLKADDDRIKQLSDAMFEPFREIIHCGLLGSQKSAAANPNLMPRWHSLNRYLRERVEKRDELPNMMINRIASRERAMELGREVKPEVFSGTLLLAVHKLFPPDVLGTPGYIAPEVLGTLHLPLSDAGAQRPNR
jgi:hypothetical protein